MHDVNDMLNIHDRHLTNINSNKFTLWMCPLFLRKFRSVLCIKANFICKEKSDLFLCKRKNKIFVKKNQICFCVKFKKKKDFIKKNQIFFFFFFLWIKGIRFCVYIYIYIYIKSIFCVKFFLKKVILSKKSNMFYE